MVGRLGIAFEEMPKMHKSKQTILKDIRQSLTDLDLLGTEQISAAYLEMAIRALEDKSENAKGEVAKVDFEDAELRSRPAKSGKPN